MRKLSIAGSAALLVGSLVYSLPASAQTIVTPSDPNGWTHLVENATGSAAITTSEPRNGNGSLELNTTDAAGRTRLGNIGPWDYMAPGVGLGEVTSLSFDWFRAAISTADAWHAPVFRLNIWDGSQRSDLVWEAVYNGYPTAGPGVPEGEWRTENLMKSAFYRYESGGAGVTMIGGSQLNQSIADWASSALYSSDARITGISIGAGSGWQNGAFTGYVDNVVFGANGSETTYNFEVGTAPTVTPEPISMALLGTGLAGIGAARRKRKKNSDPE
ncbi:MAG TPA: PEP-CTERM sorting domain-containing protein [Longimicrobiaceae bacterium]|nr:PEP-CTERM sorting domain-containing protein [Longimicrobiaceae bacterium]